MFYCDVCGNTNCCERCDLPNEPVLCDKCYRIIKLYFEYVFLRISIKTLKMLLNIKD